MTYVCPNGHPFPEVFDVGCSDCEARIACEPVAKGMRLHEQLQGAVEALDDLRRLRAMQLRGEVPVSAFFEAFEAVMAKAPTTRGQ